MAAIYIGAPGATGAPRFSRSRSSRLRNTGSSGDRGRPYGFSGSRSRSTSGSFRRVYIRGVELYIRTPNQDIARKGAGRSPLERTDGRRVYTYGRPSALGDLHDANPGREGALWTSLLGILAVSGIRLPYGRFRMAARCAPRRRNAPASVGRAVLIFNGIFLICAQAIPLCRG